MSAPEQLDEEVLLDALRNAPGAPPRERAAMWRSIASAIDVPGPGGSGGDDGGGTPAEAPPAPTTPTAGGLGAGGSLISAKLAMLGAAATFVIGAASGGVVTFLAVSPREGGPAVVVESPRVDEHVYEESHVNLTEEIEGPPPALPPAEPMEVPLAPAIPERSASRPRETTPSAVEPVPLESARDREAERALLRQAHAAMARGEATLAVETLAEHRRRYPESVQDEERSALEVAALRSAGQTARARAARAQFLERYPSSIFRELVDPPAARGE